MNTIKIFWLKRQLKKSYLHARDGFDYYTCGHSLKLHLSNDYYNACKRFNKIADKLSKLDPGAPKFRFELT